MITVAHGAVFYRRRPLSTMIIVLGAVETFRDLRLLTFFIQQPIRRYRVVGRTIVRVMRKASLWDRDLQNNFHNQTELQLRA